MEPPPAAPGPPPSVVAVPPLGPVPREAGSGSIIIADDPPEMIGAETPNVDVAAATPPPMAWLAAAVAAAAAVACR